MIRAARSFLTAPAYMLKGGSINAVVDRVYTLSLCTSRAAGLVAAIALVMMVLHVLVEIVLRSAFATSTFVLEEFLGYGIASVTSLSLGLALGEGALIRVNLLQTRLSAAARRWTEVFATVVAIAADVFLVWFIFFKTLRDFSRGTVSATIAQVPVWIWEAVVFAGLIVFGFQLLARLLVLVFVPLEKLETYLKEFGSGTHGEPV